MRIGVVPVSDKTTGGVYQCSTTLVQALGDAGLSDSVTVFFPLGEELAPDLAGLPFPRVAIDESGGAIDAFRRMLSRALPPRVAGERRAAASTEATVSSEPGVTRIRPTARGRAWAKSLRAHDLDLMIYPTSNTISFEVGIPYVVTIHDLQHRIQPEFPEVSAHGEWEAREYDLGTCIANAALVLVDSEVGKEDVLRFYGDRGITEDRVVVLPFLPASYVSAEISDSAIKRVLRRYDLTAGYLFYPAQFWPHKNHAHIVEAVALLRGQGMDVHVAFSGSHSGDLREKTFDEVREAAERLGVSDLVRYLGRVPDEDMSPLYAASAGLIMPTFFGPTNIPPLEAFGVGRPVITSDIRGIREQMGDAALLVDPRSSESIAEGIRRLLTEPDLADELVRRGREQLASYTRADYLDRLRAIIETARELVARA